MDGEKIAVPKKAIYGGLFVLLLIGVAVYGFGFYYPEHQRMQEVNTFKKLLFESTLCQYSCPLSLQDFDGEMQLLPSQECVQECTVQIQEAGVDMNKFSNNDLGNDELVADVQNAILKCRDETQSEDVIDNEKFFKCSSEELGNVKLKYDYLN